MIVAWTVALLLIASFFFFVGAARWLQEQMVAKAKNVAGSFPNRRSTLPARADLIPNLVSTVKANAQRRDTVPEQHRPALGPPFCKPSLILETGVERPLNAALLPLIRLQGNYPQLKARPVHTPAGRTGSAPKTRIAVSH